jgi:hypothetical protein
MTITPTNRKDKNAWEIPSLKTDLTSIMIGGKKTLVKRIFMLVKSVLSDGISQAFLSFRFVGVIVITDDDLFWNVGQANCILKYFENMMIDHSDSTIFVEDG